MHARMRGQIGQDETGNAWDETVDKERKVAPMLAICMECATRVVNRSSEHQI